MRSFILALALFVTIAGNGLLRTTFSASPRGLELMAKDGSLQARVFLGTDSLLLDYPIQQRGYLFRPEAYVYLNRSDKTFIVRSYAQMLSQLRKDVNSENSGWQDQETGISAAGFEFSGETNVIAGLTATKIVRSSQGKIETEMWVCEEVAPAALTAVRRELRATLPANFWNHDRPIPALLQAILVFGLPLRIVDHNSESSEVEAVAMKNVHIPDDLFEIPAEYQHREP